MTEPLYALGIDLGGTNLRVGTVSQDGTLVDFVSRPVDPSLGGDAIVAEITALAAGLDGLAAATGVGVAFAGAVLPDGEIRQDLTNLPSLAGYPLRAELSRAFDLPCQMDNDAILALLGECRFGSGRGYNDVLLLTLGTGIGGGLLLNGTLRRGPHGLGCEVGMLPFPDPTIDHLTAFESIASPKSIMQRLGDPSGHLFDRALHGDPVASAAIDEMYRLLGWLVTNLHVVLDLELVILSGGLAGVGQPLREGVLAAFRDVCPPELQFGMQVRMGTLPPQAAGVIGAACLYLEPEMVPNT